MQKKQSRIDDSTSCVWVGRGGNVVQRDYWGKKTIADGKYTPGEVDRAWSAKMEKEFAKWKKEINTIEVFEQLQPECI